ncbi:MAG TPA: hypothetical protein VL866_16790 [Pyrinomonadaceae bacterium]|nr:hypothetical protein [Pyrinomonadaceae bacterium]
MHQRVFDEVSIPIFDNIPGEVGLHQNVALVTINLTYSKETRVAPPDRITLKASPQSITFKARCNYEFERLAAAASPIYVTSHVSVAMSPIPVSVIPVAIIRTSPTVIGTVGVAVMPTSPAPIVVIVSTVASPAPIVVIVSTVASPSPIIVIVSTVVSPVPIVIVVSAARTTSIHTTFARVVTVHKLGALLVPFGISITSVGSSVVRTAYQN